MAFYFGSERRSDWISCLVIIAVRPIPGAPVRDSGVMLVQCLSIQCNAFFWGLLDLHQQHIMVPKNPTINWMQRTDSNRRPPGYEPGKLPLLTLCKDWERGWESNPRLGDYEPPLLPLHHPAILVGCIN